MCSQISGRWRTRPRISETICSLSLRPAPRLQAPSIGLVSPACRGSSVAHMAMRPCEACTAHVQGSGLALISRGPPAKAAAPRWGHVILITYFREPQSAIQGLRREELAMRTLGSLAVLIAATAIFVLGPAAFA